MGSGVAIAATPLPHTETLGNLQGSGCDAQWVAPCESGWSGWGASSKVNMVTLVGSSPTVHGMMITPGTSFWNGVKRDFDMTGSNWLEWIIPVRPVDGTANFGVRVEFKNSGGTTVGVQTLTTPIDDPTSVKISFLAPATTTTATVFFGAKDGSDGNATIVVSAMMGCTWTGFDLENPSQNQSCSGCGESDIECEVGAPVCTCDIDESCNVSNKVCDCPEESEQFQSAWE